MPNNERRQEIKNRKDQFRAMAALIGSFGAGAFRGQNKQKLSVTLNADVVAQMDSLIEHGLYSSRDDLLQTAIQNLLQEHGAEGQECGRLTATGLVVHNRKSLEKLLAAGRQIDLSVNGMLRLADDVTPELACAVIKSLKVRGTFQARAEVKIALRDHTR